MRSYGWTTSGEIVDNEAEVVRRVAAQLDDGEPLRAVARQLNDRGEVTVQGEDVGAAHREAHGDLAAHGG
ncbi:hypothetical protein [Gordonia sp. FQ]|uniref:hypothetical protein n=1 Tax=Gordonia sp. FQ TaxID=3446634 RepID=UPI003F863234